MIWTAVDAYIMVMVYMTLLTVLVTKYMSIYHGTMMAEVEEVQALKWIKVFLATMPFILCTLQYSVISSFNNMGNFQLKFMGHSEPGSGFEMVISVSSMLCLFFGIFLQIRIEYDSIVIQDAQISTFGKMVNWCKMSFTDGAASIDIDQVNLMGYSFKAIRIVTLLGTTLGLIQMLQTLGSHYMKWTKLLFGAILTVVLPFFFISKHKGMKAILKNLIKEPLVFVHD